MHCINKYNKKKKKTAYLLEISKTFSRISSMFVPSVIQERS